MKFSGCRSSSRERGGTETEIGKKAKVPLPIVSPLPEYQGWASFRLRSTSAKPPLAPLRPLQSGEEKTPERQGANNDAKTSVSASTPPSGSMVISSSPRCRNAELSLASALATSGLPKLSKAGHVLPWPMPYRERNVVRKNQWWSE